MQPTKKAILKKSMDVTGANIAVVQMEELSEDLIHHILGLLPTVDATQFSVLSKTFRSLWLSFPVLDLDFTQFSGGNWRNSSTAFFDFVERSLQARRPHIKTRLQKLRFRFTGPDPKKDDEFEAVVNRLLEFALEKSVKDLDLNVSINESKCRKGFLKFSPSLLRVLFLKSLTSLKLKGFESRLSDLSLTCPSLEYLSIYTCSGLKTIRVSCKRLKNIELRFCDGLQSVHVEAESLESFWFVGDDVTDNCEIDIFACQCLQYLNLIYARLSTKFFEQLTGLLLLQFLYLSDCFLPKRLNICNFSLKTVTMRSCFQLERVVLSAESLESFKYAASLRNDESCTFDISACTSLSKVELKGAGVTDRWVKINISALSFLEVLVLNGCKFLENIEFKNEKLVRLELENCDNLKEAVIDARNLLHFSYSGFPSDLTLIITSTKCDAKISLNKRMSDEWFGNLRKFLRSFNHCKSLTLSCSSAKDLIFPNENFWVKLSPLPDVRHLIVALKELPKTPTLVELVENLLWFVPNPKVMTIVSGTKQYSLKFQYSNQMERKEVVFCCHMLPIKCWRHHVGKIIMDNFGPEEKRHFGTLFAGYLD